MKEQINLLKNSELFDEYYYSKQIDNDDKVTISLFEHYLTIGFKKGYDPSDKFNTCFYLDTYPDVKINGMNPLIHYILYGKEEGRLVLKNEDSDEYKYVKYFDEETILENINSFERKVLVSIVMPVYNVEPKWLELAINSVKKQLYTNWELCIVDDFSTNPETIEYLKRINNQQIKIKFLNKNLHISGATNEAINMSSGEYIVFMDNDDEITRDALYEIVKTINLSNPDMIYSDEDKIDEFNNHFDPFFKPDWSPDTFMSIMYICHITCYKKEIIKQLGGLRIGYEGAQDYDLGLRFMEISSNIVHIPKVLYHWRILETSIANNMDSKPYAIESLKKAKYDAFERRKLIVELKEVEEFKGQYIPYYKNIDKPKVSIIIPTKDKVELLKNCIDSIISKSTYKNFEIIIVNNQSQEKNTLDYFYYLEKQFLNVRIINFDEKFNFSKMNNIASKIATGEFLLFLNNDTEVITEEWIENLVGYASLEHIGAVGAQLLFPKTLNIQHCGVINLNDGPGHAFYNKSSENIYHFGRNKVPYNWLAVTAACLMISKDKFEKIDKFDEKFPIAYNDVDLCYKLVKGGLYNVCCNHVKLMHYESVSRGQDHEDEEKCKRLSIEKKRLYFKHKEYYYTDPFFNPNLHPNNVYFELL